MFECHFLLLFCRKQQLAAFAKHLLYVKYCEVLDYLI